MPLIQRAEDPHLVYEEALAHLTINGAPARVVASRFKGVASPYYPVRVVISGLAALMLVADIYRARVFGGVSSSTSGGAVFVREFWNIPLLCTALLLWPIAGSVLLNINHNLTGADDQVPWPIAWLAKMGFRFVLFDGASSAERFPPAIQGAFHTPPFPSVTAPRPRAAGTGTGTAPIRVGLLGSIASIESGDDAFFARLSQLAGEEGIALCYGQRGALPEPIKRIAGVELVDTRARTGFRDYLDGLDIAVFMASKQDYFYRHSGTVMDAVASGVTPVVPGFPVLTSQVTQPVHVGTHFDSLDALPGAVQDAIAQLGTLSANRAAWHHARAECDIVLGQAR